MINGNRLSLLKVNDLAEIMGVTRQSARNKLRKFTQPISLDELSKLRTALGFTSYDDLITDIEMLKLIKEEERKNGN